MIRKISADERYHFENEWLNTYWHFSFDHYHDPANMNFGPLRVFNDDVIAPAGGFPMHGHREMEIVTYVISGTLEHHDDMGNTGIIRPGEIQRMSAGTGVHHSEFNHSRQEPVHLVQLWILPVRRGLEPSWEQESFSLPGRVGKLLAIVEPVGNGSDGTVKIHQDASIYTSQLESGQSVKHTLAEGRRAYAFIIGGHVRLNSETLAAGDQARVTGERELQLSAAPDANGTPADFLLLDLP